MVKINYAELKIDHIILFDKDIVFACCKENGCGKTRLFLASRNGCVYTRNGRSAKWEALGEEEAKNIHHRIYQGIKEGIKVYECNGSLHEVTKEAVLG